MEINSDLHTWVEAITTVICGDYPYEKKYIEAFKMLMTLGFKHIHPKLLDRCFINLDPVSTYINSHSEIMDPEGSIHCSLCLISKYTERAKVAPMYLLQLHTEPIHQNTYTVMFMLRLLHPDKHILLRENIKLRPDQLDEASTIIVDKCIRYFPKVNHKHQLKVINYEVY